MPKAKSNKRSLQGAEVSVHRLVRQALGYCVLVHWTDSAARPGWNEIDQSGPALISSVGILMRYTENYIVLAMGVSSSGNCHEQITIPLGCVNSFQKLSTTQIKPQ
jgi:hypothetical protein